MASLSDVEVLEGDLVATGMKFGIIVGRFNAFITERLLEGAIDALVRHGGDAKDITVVRVPGSFEIPAAARKLVEAKRFDAVVGLGCLMRGDTIHFDLIAGEVTKGLASLAQTADIPVTFGVLTTDSLEQSVHRAGAKYGNKGAEAVMAAVELVSLYRAIQSSASPTTKPRARRRK